MPMIVYVDLLFLTNLFFDAFVLLLTARVRRLHLTVRRLAVSALVGAAYVLPMFHPSFGFLYTTVAKLAFSLFVVRLAFGFHGLQRFAGTAGTFYLVQFAAAGGVFAVHFLLLSSGDVLAGLMVRQTGAAAFALETGLWLSLPAFLLSLWFFRAVFVSQSRVQLSESLTADVEIAIGDVTVACRGLIDTGNRLYDPVSRAPVLVMEAAAWAAHLPDGWLPMIRRGEADLILAEAGEGRVPFAWPDRLRLIPGRGAGGRPQLFLSLKPDRVTILAGSRKYESERALVALDGGTMDHGGGFQAIVHPMLVTH